MSHSEKGEGGSHALPPPFHGVYFKIYTLTGLLDPMLSDIHIITCDFKKASYSSVNKIDFKVAMIRLCIF